MKRSYEKKLETIFLEKGIKLNNSFILEMELEIDGLIEQNRPETDFDFSITREFNGVTAIIHGSVSEQVRSNGFPFMATGYECIEFVIKGKNSIFEEFPYEEV